MSDITETASTAVDSADANSEARATQEAQLDLAALSGTGGSSSTQAGSTYIDKGGIDAQSRKNNDAWQDLALAQINARIERLEAELQESEEREEKLKELKKAIDANGGVYDPKKHGHLAKDAGIDDQVLIQQGSNAGNYVGGQIDDENRKQDRLRQDIEDAYRDKRQHEERVGYRASAEASYASMRDSPDHDRSAMARHIVKSFDSEAIDGIRGLEAQDRVAINRARGFGEADIDKIESVAIGQFVSFGISNDEPAPLADNGLPDLEVPEAASTELAIADEGLPSLDIDPAGDLPAVDVAAADELPSLDVAPAGDLPSLDIPDIAAAGEETSFAAAVDDARIEDSPKSEKVAKGPPAIVHDFEVAASVEPIKDEGLTVAVNDTPTIASNQPAVV